MTGPRPLPRRSASVAIRRAGVLAAVCCLPLAAGVAEAKSDKHGGDLPPGQAKKLPIAPVPQVGAQAAPDKSSSKQPAPAPATEKVKGPKKALPPAAAPSKPDRTVTPQAPAAAPASPAAAPAVAAPAAPTATPAPTAPVRRRAATRTKRDSGRSAPRSGVAGADGAGTSGSSRTTGGSAGDAPSSATPRSETDRNPTARPERKRDDEGSIVTRTVRDIVETVPGWIKAALAALAALSLLLGGAYLLATLRARSLARQRGELLSEVGLLQSALLPQVPETVGVLATSVAYRPADGPCAGGDFYDVIALPDGRAGFILGDVSGHGREALQQTAFMRYTLRAYLEAGLEPRVALQVAERAIGEQLGGDFATVLLAIHDPRTASLAYATAGHPAPIVVRGHESFRPVVAGSSPPIGIGERTGLRQTRLPLMPGMSVCLYTDGLIEARTKDGMLGADRLEQIVAELDSDAKASDLIERVRTEAAAVPDDMAACLLSPTAGITAGNFRTELLEVSDREADGPLPRRFIEECGVAAEDLDEAEREIRETAAMYGGAIVSVEYGARRAVRVLPRNVATIESATWRAAARA